MIASALAEEAWKLVCVIRYIVGFGHLNMQSKVEVWVALDFNFAIVELASLPANCLSRVLLNTFNLDVPSLAAAAWSWARQLLNRRVGNIVGAILVVCHAGVKVAMARVAAPGLHEVSIDAMHASLHALVALFNGGGQVVACVNQSKRKHQYKIVSNHLQFRF